MAIKSEQKQRNQNDGVGPFERLKEEEVAREVADSQVHVLKDGIICDTEKRGYATPENRSPFEIVVDATEGFIPLWARGMTLRWRFRQRSLRVYRNPEAVKAGVRQLFGEAVFKWGDAAPVRFTERDDAWDFEIVMRGTDDCDAGGCVLASAFFPDPGQNTLDIYPRMFTQNRKEQIDTLVHEIGHIFGLRHFFAQISEREWPSEIFGTHAPFSIMNYGQLSELTATDKADLKRLYQQVWNRRLRAINRTPIRLIRPFHTIGESIGRLTDEEPVETGAAVGAAIPLPARITISVDAQPAGESFDPSLDS